MVPTPQRQDRRGELALSVVIPSFNSEGWIGRTLEHLAVAFRTSSFDELEVVLVDDGSTDRSVNEARSIAAKLQMNLSIVEQSNSGRHKARLAGLSHCKGSHVLLIDTRVFLHENSLEFVGQQFEREPDEVWTAHVVADTTNNPLAGFWQAIEHVAWRRYFKHPRQMKFGEADFDYFPKGTTALIGSRKLISDAFASFVPNIDDWHKANDDTAILRSIAHETGISISPRYSCTYNARTTLREFLRHAHHRGAVLVDGYWVEGARFRHAISLFLLGSVVVPFLFVFGIISGPSFAIAMVSVIGVLGGMATLAVAARTLGAQWHDALVLARYSPLFAIWYGTGIWRGALLRVQSSRRRQQ